MIIDPYNFQKVKITNIRAVSSETVVVSVNKPAGYTFTPGQYAIIRAYTQIGVPQTRQYSFISSDASQQLDFLIRHQHGGQVSTWFTSQAKVGDEIEVSSPHGNFVRSDDRSVLLIAGGSGIAPFLSMLRADANNLSVIYSENTADKIAYNQELHDTLADNYHSVVSSKQGRISPDSLQLAQKYEQIFICGSKLFVDDIYALLIQIGIPSDAIKRELFTLQ